MNGWRTAHPAEILHGGGVALACGLDGSMSADELHGLFAADTRVLSTYRLSLGGVGLELLSRMREGHGTARWQFQNRRFRVANSDIEAGSISIGLRRRVNGAMHDDLRITSYVEGTLRTSVILQLDADFADIFEVKMQRLPPHLGIGRSVNANEIRLGYENQGFKRALLISTDGPKKPPLVVGSQLQFDIELAHGATWSCCLEMSPEVDGQRVAFLGDPHNDEDAPPDAISIDCADTLGSPFRRGCADLDSLTISDGGSQYIAAGVPWFLTLFGRDTLMTSLMTGLLGSSTVRGTLTAVGALQATVDDAWRDAEPGKLPHEIRSGELAFRHLIPHTPYYGTHDAQALYCLALWNAWRWTGDRQLLADHLDTARAALRWCDDHGDLDGDGLQEYRTRSRDGYYDQGWKDAGDAIVHVDGRIGSLPLATVELQGYLYAARLAMAELVEAEGDTGEAERQRHAAAALADLVEQRYFLEEEGFYALALDGAKQPLRSISSNPGHLLWCGLPSAAHAAAVADRLLRPDMNSGWGLRTLSSEHPAYSALSYQRGSVWPHDTVLAAVGMFRYGLRDQAAVLLRGILEAARAFENDRLPELFCGFDRSEGPPVPYATANVPQAWAAAAPVLVAQIFLGLVPDAPRQRCFLTPWLPDWLPRLEVNGIAIGNGTLDIVISRTADGMEVEVTNANEVEVIFEPVGAPLWGTPLVSGGHRPDRQ